MRFVELTEHFIFAPTVSKLLLTRLLYACLCFFFLPLGHNSVCRLARLPRQHEGSLGAAGAQGKVL